MSGGTLNVSNLLGVGDFSLIGGTINTSGMLSGQGNLSLGSAGVINGTGQVFFRSNSAPLVVDGAINVTGQVGLAASTLTLNRSLQAQNISLDTDNAVILGAGVVLVASNGEPNYPWGSIYVRSFSSGGTVRLGGAGSVIDPTQLSAIGGVGRLQASWLAVDGYSGNLVVDGVVNIPDVQLELRAPSITINQDVSASNVYLNAGSPITLAAGKTVTATGSGANGYGIMRFANFNTAGQDWQLGGAGSLVDVTQLANGAGTGGVAGG